MVRLALGLAALAGATFLYACAGLVPSAPTQAPNAATPPNEIRSGSAEMVIQRVEREISPDEVATAVQRLLADAKMCIPWPSLWIEEQQSRRAYLVRFDLMARDWGAALAADSDARMQEFVAMGLLTRRERPDVAAGAVTFELTREGGQFISGSLRGETRLTFCLPAERQLLAVTSLEWGEFACGGLRVHFTHVAQAWPSWARTEASQRRVTQTWATLGQAMPGSVTLSRQWFPPNRLPAGMARNGELRSVCYDQARQRVVGDDLNLGAPTAGLQ